ncbi:MAG TPA: VWA domain-containing protein, partial [Thiothrix sp.]|nr:VWA domain-containing protein [Thiothrix sp.]
MIDDLFKQKDNKNKMFYHWVRKTLGGVNKPFLASLGLMLGVLIAANSQAQELEISRVPLFLTTPVSPNVLIVLDNSNSMDETPDGTLGKTGVPNPSDLGGSAHPDSKSEIARRVMKSVVNDYQGRLNLGLMAYQQENVAAAHVHNTLVDLAYSVAPNDPNFIYDPNFQGARESNTKHIEFTNPSDPASFLYANVNLPFYSSVNQGTSFCYSPTAQAFNNGEVIPSGPWDRYRCFENKTGGSNTLPIWADSADEAAQGYSNYLFTVNLYPTDSDIAQGITDFGRYLFWDHAGPTWYANSSPGRGYLHVPIDDVDATQKTKLDKKLATSQFIDNQPTGADFPLQNAGLTPLQGSLKSAKDYFTKNAKPSEGYPQAVCDALPESCDKNYVILVTDGMPSVDDAGNEPATPELAITQVETAAAELQAAGVKTYVIGFALPFGVDDSQLDRIASEGGTGLAYDASDEASLEAAINAILYDIFEQTASSAPLSFSNKFLNPESNNPNPDPDAEATKTYVYQTQFTSIDWTGTVKAYAFDSNGQLKPNPEWTATDAGKIPLADHRIILSATRDNCTAGVCDPLAAVAFRWSALTNNDQALFNHDETLLNYIRGDQSLEGTVFRERKHLMGDIIQSESLYVGEPFYHYPDILESKPYSNFV